VSESTRVYGGVSAEDRRAKRRGRLVEAGLELLGREGWKGATVRGVCAEAGLTERYFYESFAGRDELMHAVFDTVAAEAAAAVLEAIERAPHDARAKSRAAIEAFVRLLTDDPRRARAMLVESQVTPELRERREAAIGAFAALISERGREFYGPEAASELDAELTALALVGGLMQLLVSWLEGHIEIPRERLVEHCAGLLVAASTVSSEP
jgi:AcrR family transcriptional regulator